jgi:hypothetical protein
LFDQAIVASRLIETVDVDYRLLLQRHPLDAQGVGRRLGVSVDRDLIVLQRPKDNPSTVKKHFRFAELLVGSVAVTLLVTAIGAQGEGLRLRCTEAQQRNASEV